MVQRAYSSLLRAERKCLEIQGQETSLGLRDIHSSSYPASLSRNICWVYWVKWYSMMSELRKTFKAFDLTKMISRNRGQEVNNSWVQISIYLKICEIEKCTALGRVIKEGFVEKLRFMLRSEELTLWISRKRTLQGEVTTKL